jgi:predicted flap endonuclease-1-like 5' DNA nuclease
MIMAKLVDVEGIDKKYAEKLIDIGIRNTDDLLNMGCSTKGRKSLADKTGISGDLILEWVNHVDLFRIEGVGEEYSDLLEEAGVDTVPELARRNPENLHAQLIEINKTKALVRHVPGLSQVQSWIEQAKTLPRVVEY